MERRIDSTLVSEEESSQSQRVSEFFFNRLLIIQKLQTVFNLGIVIKREPLKFTHFVNKFEEIIY